MIILANRRWKQDEIKTRVKLSEEKPFMPGVSVHIFNLSIWKADTGGFLETRMVVCSQNSQGETVSKRKL